MDVHLFIYVCPIIYIGFNSQVDRSPNLWATSTATRMSIDDDDVFSWVTALASYIFLHLLNIFTEIFAVFQYTMNII